MSDQTTEYKPPPTDTVEQRLAEPAFVVAFQQVAGFEPYALRRPKDGIVGREVLQQASKAVLNKDLRDPAVSRAHCRLELSQGGGGILDLECTSDRGLRLNGWDVKKGEHAKLLGGEVLRMGGTVMTYVRELPVAAPADFLKADADVDTEDGKIVAPFGLREVRAELGRLGRTGARVVLVHGETGTGKERVAYAVAEKLGAKHVIPCLVASLPTDQIIAELFGVAAGAATGVRERDGAVREAAGTKGALFLDEIGELPPDAQVALLRFLESGEIQPFGSKRGGPSSGRNYRHVPVVLATHRPIDKLVERGKLREDLVARIQQRIEIPPLRRRSYDALSILRQLCGGGLAFDADRISADAVEMLLLGWHKDNVRGLNRLAMEAKKHSSTRLTFDDAMVKATVRNRTGDERWWRAAACPAAVAEALRSAPGKKKGGAASQADAAAWLNERAVGPKISEGTFKGLIAAARSA